MTAQTQSRPEETTESKGKEGKNTKKTDPVEEFREELLYNIDQLNTYGKIAIDYHQEVIEIIKNLYKMPRKE